MSTGHALFSPSKSGMWMNCPGSMAFPENQDPDGGSSSYADDGSATHHWGAKLLTDGVIEIGDTIEINGTTYTLDEERHARVTGYGEDVLRRALGGYLYVEQRVDLSHILGEDQGGTADALIVLPHLRLGIVEDLKDGSGEKVYASYLVEPATDTTPEVRAPNPQLALYALGSLPSFDLFDEIQEVLLVIYQPKLNHIDEFKISRGTLLEFGKEAALAVELARIAMVSGPRSLTTAGYLHAGTKQCRWCRAAARCPELASVTEKELRMDFDDEQSQPSIPNTETSVDLGLLYAKVPLVELWCKAVKAELAKRVAEGEAILGPDGKPFKFVEGKSKGRAWTDEKAAEAALTAQLGPKAYTEPKILTAPAAAKVLDKKATKALWNDLFVPLIHSSPGLPTLVPGSDPRPAIAGSKAEDFEQEDLGT